MTLKATEILQLKLEDDLADLSPFDRTSVDIMDLIRAIFKELHAGGEYAKGKGREFLAWLKKHYPSAMWLPFERALGSRMDLSFDGCVPIFWNRTIILEFLNSLLVPGADNKLETYLWRALSCNEMVAHLRVCTLFQIIISEPMRWLAGKASKSLTDWSIVNSSEVLELAEAAFKTIAADGHSLLDPSLDPFAAIAAKQPLFAAWRAAEEQQTVKASTAPCTSTTASWRRRAAPRVRATRWLPRWWSSWPRSCLLYTSPSPRDFQVSRMPSSA